MRFERSPLLGAIRIRYDAGHDRRGTFLKYFDAEAFGAAGLCRVFSQAAFATNQKKGTIRGLHYQSAPHEEIKLVRCVHGRIFDVLVDLRHDSPTFGRWEGFTLDANAPEALYVPAGFAHGYQTLSDDSSVEYLISAPYLPELQRGIHWNSTSVSIAWPLPLGEISDRDDAFAPFEPGNFRTSC